MKTQALRLLCAVLFFLLAAPAFSQDLEIGCPGPQGPVFGKLNAGLYTADLFDDGGTKVGIVETFNTVDLPVVLPIHPRLRKMITAGATGDQMREVGVEEGMTLLTQNAVAQARARVTSLAEAYRVRLD